MQYERCTLANNCYILLYMNTASAFKLNWEIRFNLRKKGSRTFKSTTRPNVGYPRYATAISFVVYEV